MDLIVYLDVNEDPGCYELICIKWKGIYFYKL